MYTSTLPMVLEHLNSRYLTKEPGHTSKKWHSIIMTVTGNPNLKLTRSIGVICLSRYLQNLTVTVYQTLKQPNYLYTLVLYRDRRTSRTRQRKYCAILACHRDILTAHKRDKNPAGCASNANSLNCRAVMLKF